MKASVSAWAAWLERRSTTRRSPRTTTRRERPVISATRSGPNASSKLSSTPGTAGRQARWVTQASRSRRDSWLITGAPWSSSTGVRATILSWSSRTSSIRPSGKAPIR